MFQQFFCYLIIAAAAVACGRPPRDPATLVFHNMSEPRTLDPAGATGIAEKNLLLAMAEGLTTLDPKTALPAPGVAERFETSADGKTLQFFLRDCKWSNGEPVVAADFRDSWLRVLDPATASPLANLLFSIDGAKAFHEGRAARDAVKIVATEPTLLTIQFEAPDPRFIQLCASSPLVPVHKSAFTTAGFFVHSEAFVGNGPFVLEKRIPNFKIVFKKNINYWDSANVKIERIVAFAAESKQTAVDAFAGGQTDWVDDFPAAQAGAWKGRPELRASPYLATFFLRFNTTKKPFDDRRVREAIHRAIDRESICSYILKLGQRPALNLVPKCMETHTNYKCAGGAPFDPRRARELLTEAGFPGGFGIPPVEFQYDTNEDHRRVAEAIQEMLKKNLNIDVFLLNKEKKVHIDDEEHLRYGGMSRGSWIADYVDPMTFLEVFESGAPSNRTGFRSPEFDGLLTSARREIDPAGRALILQKAEELLVTREFPMTPIYEYVKQTLVNPARITGGFYENPLGYHPMKWIRLADH